MKVLKPKPIKYEKEQNFPPLDVEFKRLAELFNISIEEVESIYETDKDKYTQMLNKYRLKVAAKLHNRINEDLEQRTTTESAIDKMHEIYF